MPEENIHQEFRLKYLEEITNFFIKKLNQNELMSKKHEKVSTTLNYVKKYFNFCGYWICFNFCFYFFT